MTVEIGTEDMYVPINVGEIYDDKLKKKIPNIIKCKVVEPTQFVQRALKYAFSNGLPKYMYNEHLESIYQTMQQNFHITHSGDKPHTMFILKNAIRALYDQC
jgi:hypothetical protein